MENNSNSVIKLNNSILLYYRKFLKTSLAGISFKIHLNDYEKIGLPHLVEHVLVNQIPTPEYIKLSGSTNKKSLSIKILGNASDLEIFVPIFLSRLFKFKMMEQDLQAEKAVVIQEFKQYRNSKLERFANIARNCSFKVSDLFRDEILGDIKNISSFSIQDIYNFLDNHLITNNISVLFAGNCDTFHKIKTILNKYNLKTNQLKNTINGLAKSCPPLSSKKVIGYRKNKEDLAQLSFIYRIDNECLDIDKILALSILFSLLNSGRYSVLAQIKIFIPELYFFQAIPIFRENGIYLQLLTSCSTQDINLIEEKMRSVFITLVNLNSFDLKDIIHSLEFQQNLLFDGVEKSISSFANMQLEQEKIINLCNINVVSILKKYKKLICNLVDQSGSIVISYI